MAYGARLESGLGESPQGFKSPTKNEFFDRQIWHRLPPTPKTGSNAVVLLFHFPVEWGAKGIHRTTSTRKTTMPKFRGCWREFSVNGLVRGCLLRSVG